MDRYEIEFLAGEFLENWIFTGYWDAEYGDKTAIKQRLIELLAEVQDKAGADV